MAFTYKTQCLCGMWRVKGRSGQLSFTVINAKHHLTFPAPMIFSAAYTESPHLEHFSAPPYFWANLEVLGFVLGLWGWTLWKGEKKLFEIFQRALVCTYRRHLVLYLMAGGLPRPVREKKKLISGAAIVITLTYLWAHCYKRPKLKYLSFWA